MKIGIIGTGWVAGLHLDALRQIEDAEVVAIAGRNEARAKELAQPIGAKTYSRAAIDAPFGVARRSLYSTPSAPPRRSRTGLLGTRDNPPKHGKWSGVDYAAPAVRDLAYAIVAEVTENYDVDGIELDFWRHPVFFKRSARGEVLRTDDRALMTDVIRRRASNWTRSGELEESTCFSTLSIPTRSAIAKNRPGHRAVAQGRPGGCARARWLLSTQPVADQCRAGEEIWCAGLGLSGGKPGA